MKFYDLHQDLMTHIRFKDRLGQTEQTSWQVLEASELDLLIATAFPFPESDDQTDPIVNELITEELQMYRDYMTQSETWQLIESARDLENEKKKLILHIEGLNTFDGTRQSWQHLEEWIGLGVRSIGTHWNIENKLGGGTLQPDNPLTTLGHEVIEYIEANSIVLDLAHMSRAGFADVARFSKRPLYVSHGNADAVCQNVRNYTDEQLFQIAESDGVIGMFFAGTFVAGKDRASTINDVVAHIDYIKNLIGTRHIAIGGDWGGIVSGGVKGLESVADAPTLFDALTTAGYSAEEQEQIAWQNADRVLRAHL